MGSQWIMPVWIASNLVKFCSSQLRTQSQGRPADFPKTQNINLMKNIEVIFIPYFFFAFQVLPCIDTWLRYYLSYVELAFGESSSGFVSFKISSWNLLWDKEASVRRRSFTSCRRNHGKNSGFSPFRENPLFDKKKSSIFEMANIIQCNVQCILHCKKKEKHPLRDVH